MDEDVLPIYVPKVSLYHGILENLLTIEGLEWSLSFPGRIGSLLFSHEGLGPVIRIPDVATKRNKSG